jgi:hypothetical protein
MPFDSNDCDVLADALEKAWEIFVKGGGLTPQDNDLAYGALAYSLLDAARSGQRNPRVLAMKAVAGLNRFWPAVAHRQWGLTSQAA